MEKETVTREMLARPFGGHAAAYSRYYLTGVTLEDAAQMLNDPRIAKATGPRELMPGNGEEDEHGAYFELSGELPALVYPMTRILGCRGYAHMDWSVEIFEAADNGLETENYTAEWDKGSPREEEGLYHCRITITDPEGGTFEIGAGHIGEDDFAYYNGIVIHHRPKG